MKVLKKSHIIISFRSLALSKLAQIQRNLEGKIHRNHSPSLLKEFVKSKRRRIE